MISVYPCVYREHNSHEFIINYNAGLSLCIQGTQLNTRIQIPALRFIPVYTGNTAADRFSMPGMAVYPCVYREHIFDATDAILKGGLSLCIQGTRTHG